MTTVQLIKKAYHGNISQMARDTGIPYQRLYKLRLQDGCDGRITLDELRSLLRHAEYPLTDEEILTMVKGEKHGKGNDTGTVGRMDENEQGRDQGEAPGLECASGLHIFTEHG